MGRESGELATWVAYALAGLLGAATYIAGLYQLEERTDWPLYLILPIALQAGLLVSFLADESVTFRRERPQGASFFGARFLHYEKLLLPSAAINGLVTLAGKSAGLPIWTAAAIGLLAALAWNFAFVIPSVWALWRRPKGSADGRP
jgi:putative flippase GtrA